MQEKIKRSRERKNILITGPPGIGKTTLIKGLSKKLQYDHPAGFFTEEIRDKGVRKGFALVRLDGMRSTLSHVEIRSCFKVSKYGVDIKYFEDFLNNIDFLKPETDLIIIDEIGKMECFSRKFIELLKSILNSEKRLIATISMKGESLIEEIKKRHDVKLFVMTHSNRETLLSEILKWNDTGML